MKRRSTSSTGPDLFGTQGMPAPDTKPAKPSASPWIPPQHTLPALRAAMPSCEGCDLYRHATQVVPGKGAARAPLLLVGEQPGDQEDQQGVPFVGPAGRILHKAMEELSIDPATVFVTNAVKHFKFTQRGKLRLHQSPRMSEITACRPWLLAEIQTVRPRVILCLGATAAKSLLGSAFSLTQSRGRILSTPFAEKVMATYHPSAILRAQDAQGSDDLYHFLKLDLQVAHETALAA
jgi:uracil-DNA glycosylase family protein